MFKYTIKKNGYTINQSKGKSEAIRSIINDIDHSKPYEAKWSPVFKDMKCVVKYEDIQDVYTTERGVL